MTSPEREPSVSLLDLIEILKRRRRTVIACAVGFLLLALVFSLLGGTKYVARSAFMPQRPGTPVSGLAGLAAQFGFRLDQVTGGESPDFYEALVRSEDLRRAAALAGYRFATPDGDSMAGTLLDIWDVRGRTPEERVRAAASRLRGKVSARVDVRAGLVRLETLAEWPELAVQLNRRVLDLVNEFNLEKRQTNAAAERRFVEERLAEARRELEEAERDLERFLQRNRLYRDSPELVFAAERLQRIVDQRQAVVTGLVEAYERARIEEVRNTPVITVVDAPEGSARRAGSLVLRLLVGLVLGVVIGVPVAFLREYLARERAERAAA